MAKKTLLSLCFLYFLACSHGYCSETAYKMTQSEWTQLQTIFQELENSNNKQLDALKQSKTDLLTTQSELTKYRAELQEQKKILAELREELNRAHSGLQATASELQQANESLEKFAQEMKKKQRKKRKIERQRNVAYIVAAVAFAKAA